MSHTNHDNIWTDAITPHPTMQHFPSEPLSPHPSTLVSTSLPLPYKQDPWTFFRTRRRRTLIALLLVASFLVLFFAQARIGEDRERRICFDSVKLDVGHEQAHLSVQSPSAVTVTAPAQTETVTVFHGNAPIITAVTASPPATTEPVHQLHTVEPVVFAFIMWSENSAIEGSILIKSAIMYSTRPLEFHIICDESSQKYLQGRLSLLHHPLFDVTVRFYRPSWQSMVDRISREGGISTDHSAGVPGLMKLFIHEILPDSVAKAIYVDTDAFFLTDPTLLWQTFSNMNASTAISMPTHPDQKTPHWHNASKICSCIMLLDLSKLRALRLMDSSFYRDDTSGRFPPALSPPTFEALFGPPGPDGHYKNVALGDQGYYWAIVSNRTDLFEHLSYDWEVSSCLLDMYGTGIGHDDATEEEQRRAMLHLNETPHQGEAIMPKLLHFNCLDGVDVYFEWTGWYDPDNSLTQRWGSALDYHVGTKWIWLNRGRGKLDMDTIVEPLFADQRFALEHSRGSTP